ncbi:MAG: glutamate racemase [Steroidobacteraceae bacterium]
MKSDTFSTHDEASELPIGVFDSGVGGLTVLRALRARMPHEQFIYLGDTARLPYGTKSAASVQRYSLQAANALVQLGIKCLVVACNTASAVALPALAQRFSPVDVIGVVAPGARACCALSRSGVIAVLATEGTVRGGAYQRAILELRDDAQVHACACPLFVALAEEGWTDGPIVEAVAHRYLDALLARRTQRPDTVLLGCTHFPVLADALRGVLGGDVHIVDSAQTTAQEVERRLAAAGRLRTHGSATVRFLATDGAERFARVGSLFLSETISPTRVEIVDLSETVASQA